MVYYEIDFTKVFKKEIEIDAENELICYKGLVIGEVEKMRCYVKYTLHMPTLKDKQFDDMAHDKKDIFTDYVRFDVRGGIYLCRGTDFLKIGYDGSSIEIRLPYMCKKEK